MIQLMYLYSKPNCANASTQGISYLTDCCFLLEHSRGFMECVVTCIFDYGLRAESGFQGNPPVQDTDYMQVIGMHISNGCNM